MTNREDIGNWTCAICGHDSGVSVNDNPPDGWDLATLVTDDGNVICAGLACEHCMQTVVLTDKMNKIPDLDPYGPLDPYGWGYGC